MEIKTNKLTGPPLDWAVAKCTGQEEEYLAQRKAYPSMTGSPSNIWSQGGPIIEREKIATWADGENGNNFFASTNEGRGNDYCGPTYLIAAMRCYVASKFGHTIEIPNELVIQESGVDRTKSRKTPELSAAMNLGEFTDYVNAFAFGHQFSVSDEEIGEVMGGRDQYRYPVAGALEGKVLALAKFDDIGVVFQSKGRGEARVFLADTLSRVPAVGEIMKVEWKDGKGVVLPLVAEKVLGR